MTFLSFSWDADGAVPVPFQVLPVDPLQGRLESQLQEAAMEGHLDLLR